jgi:hypothetical protein
MRAQQKEMVRMRLIKQTVPENCEIALFGDIHLGSVACYEKGVQQVANWVRGSKNRFWAGMGDTIEAITTDDKRYQATGKKDIVPVKQAKAAVEMLRPIADRGLVLLSGNHEFALHRVGDFGESMAEELGVPYGGRTCKVALHGKHGLTFKMYLCHPSHVTLPAGAKDHEQRLANRKASLKRVLANKAADCLLMGMGHVHQLLVADPARKLSLYDDGCEIKQAYTGLGDGRAQRIDPDSRYYCATGSFYRSQVLGEDVYSEQFGYDPVELGYIVVTVRDGKLAGVREAVV